ncbi:HIT domain-containing protein [Candidatus Woesearchaeota archaeon]|nr:HIT domain-containing protein [Candidatus Woesearchaeota archaeon]
MKCLFCGFISGKRKVHDNRFPFKILDETQNTIAFLSVDFPSTENGHVLVIPKKHFENLEDVPKTILSELINEVKKISKILRVNHKGTNVLLKNGKYAGQKIMHTHFHIIPRNPDDDIEIEIFKRKRLSFKEYNRLFNSLKKLIS